MAASTHSPSLLSSSSSSAGGTLAEHYNVFLSFRGPDTRRDFTDCLYKELIHGATALVFRDEEEIRGGEEINPTLIKAIERSDISIPIISPRYAESKACLMELAHMSLCRKIKGHKIIPIFYHTKPDILEGFPLALEEKLGESSKLAEIFDNYKGTIFDAWKETLADFSECKEKYYILTKVVTRSSTDGQTMRGLEQTWTQYWTKLFYEVVSDVKAHLRRDEVVVTNKLVGIDHHVKEIMRKLGVADRDGRAVELVCGEELRVVTITGLSGIGKTTLAKVVFNKIHHLFQACSFLENIQESLHPLDQLESLQQKLISDLNKREYQKSNYNTCITTLKTIFKKTGVLIVLDDVRDIKDVEGLAADCNWFGPGSRIILTSSTGVGEAGLVKGARKHEVKEMDKDLALQLFRKHAYGRDLPQPLNEYESLAKKIVDAVTGIPRAIEIVGARLREGRNIDMWQEVLTSLEKSPLQPVYKSFEVIYSFLGEKFLGGWTQQIFLDIACFLVGTDKKVAEYLWHACDYTHINGIKCLRDMCWVQIKENNEFWMPDQLQKFGKERVEREHKKFWKRSRLWNHKEAKKTLKEKLGNENVRALGIGHKDDVVNLTDEHFEGFSKLVFLKLHKTVISGNSNKHLSSLLWLDLQGCPTMTESLRSFNLAKLVILDLSGSPVDHQWNGWNLIMKKAMLLKVLKLIGCRDLRKSPSFWGQMNLEMLILERCFTLSLICPSIQSLQKLKFLNLKYCKLVGSLPYLGQMPELEELLVDGTSITEFHLRQGSMKKLKILSARRCKNLRSLPSSIGDLECLTQLVLDGAIEIDRLPDSVTSLMKLQVLSMRGCKKITSLPTDIGNLQSLEILVLWETSIARLPYSIGQLEKLRVLKMRRTYLGSFPDQVTSLGNLEVMDLRDCWNLQGEIPSCIKGLLSLRVLRLSFTAITSLPESIAELFHLQVLELCECSQLQAKTIPLSLTDTVIRCPTGSHHDHGEFSQFEHAFS